ncbi:ABC-type polysaccharide/polyol phosphate export permease [Cereibacter ovatus]|uniref:ABC-type polysaccharide/polyol phosphate export permease n=2 Tax=Cereibacter ovatus TaxID=439529 RepID=A0A285CXL8_9RHOB|nr:ABC-type polysaccharide/polyol phosphate export permease [Cereibacter ovatus]
MAESPQARPRKDTTDMFRPQTRKTTARSAFALLELIFHASVRSIRKSHGNAILGLLINLAQTVVMIAVFYALFEVLNLRRIAIRGNYLLFMMSGVFMYMTHVKAMGAVIGADGPTSAMMKHAPMNTIVAIASAALGALYIQVLTLFVVLYGYHAVVEPITVDQPVGAAGMFLLSWISGVAIGMVFRAAKPWAPDAVGILSAIYMRGNMIASGKMFVANMLPGYMLWLFNWNPLFHTIDQTRGFVFLNYNPHYSSVTYPLIVTAACLMIGLMGEFYTRLHASASWAAGR